MRVVATAAALAVQKSAADVGKIDSATLLVLKLGKTTPSAAVTEALPLPVRHLGEALASPKWTFVGSHPLKPPAFF